MGATGCASAPDGAEGAAKTTEALNSPVACPANYPNAGLPFDTSTTQCQSSGDWDHTGIIAPRSFVLFDDGFYYGAECGHIGFNHDYVVGVSRRTDFARPHSAKCSSDFHNVQNPSSRHYLSRADSAGHKINDPQTSQIGRDWAVGSIKAECGFHEVVTGIAQTEAGEVDAISCSPATVNGGNTCNAVPFDAQNHCGQNCTGSSDWAVNYYKNVCRTDQYIKGVSKELSQGFISSILCCNWN
jgi:hypothetical protein